ncbi:MAG: protein kinase [Polyangiales bacterium]
MRPGERFDSYVIKEKLASGGMADVVRAERVGALGVTREVCIKRIKREFCRDTDFVEMFIDEARISSSLRHSNIVAVEHFGMVDETLFMAMEWVHGVDASRLLARVLERKRALPLDAALFIVGELLAGLEYAHGKTDERGRWLEIVHRDVSPHNLIVSFEGDVKLSDFGIAKATSRLHQTQGGIIKGKVPYMAPEQVLGLALDCRTDLFAVGVTAYELLTGRRPYEGASDTDGVHAMLKEERVPLRSLRGEVPPAVDELVSRLLRIDASQRYQGAGEAIEALTRMPAYRSGQRTLKRVLRELYDGEAFSTLTPRFDHPGSHAIAPAGAFDATVAAPPYATGSDAKTTVAAKPFDDAPTVVRGAPKVSARPATLPATREQRPVDPTPGPIAVVKVPDEPVATAAASPRAKRSLGTVTAVGATLIVGIGAGSVGTGALLRHGATTSAAPSAVAVARVVATVPEAREVIDAGAPAAARPAAPTSAPVQPPQPPQAPQLATVTASADPWGTLSIDGQHSTDGWATWRVPPGRHRITARRLGETVSCVVDVRPGERQHRIMRFPGAGE